MSDNTKITGPADAQQINIHEPYEVRYWTQHLGVSEQKLRQAVSAVGPMVKNVREYLKTH